MPPEQNATDRPVTVAAPARAGVLPHIALVLEQTLGHVTHGDNLRSLLGSSARADVTILPIEFAVAGRAAKVPGYSNWTVRAGVRARRAIGRAHRRRPIAAMFIHTQVLAVLNQRWMGRIPSIVSVDATPLQYDQLGEHYAHDTSSPPVERLKKWLNTRCYRRAAHIVTWSSWARASLIDDYGIDGAKITVLAPGVQVDRWTRPHGGSGADGTIRVLFVGGDLDRKGGRLLVEAARQLRDDPEVPRFEVHLVTRTEIPPEPGIVVHHGLGPNSPALIDLYHSSDVFCLPTLGDCLPMVLSEAGAARLALISTDVGAIREIVRPDDTGLLVPTGDVGALRDALRRLLCDGDLRHRLSGAAAELVGRDFDAGVNAERLLDLLLGLAATR